MSRFKYEVNALPSFCVSVSYMRINVYISEYSKYKCTIVVPCMLNGSENKIFLCTGE